MAKSDFKIETNADGISKAIMQAAERALEAASIHMVGEVKDRAPVESGELRRSISRTIEHSSGKLVAKVGSNLPYAVYHEFGTGEFAENGAGRKGYWVYVKGSGSNGFTKGKTYTLQEAKQIMAILRKKGLDAHITKGVKASKFLRDAFRANKKNIQSIINAEMENL